MLASFFTIFLFAISAVCARSTSAWLGGLTANLLRLLLATLLLAVWAHGFGSGLGGAAFGWFLLSGLVGFGLGDVALFQALPRIGSRLTLILVQCLAAPLAAAAEWLWLGTRLSGGEMLCGAVILAGVAVALAPSGTSAIPRRTLWVGVGFGVIGALGQAWGAVLSRRAYQVAEMAGEAVDGGTAAYQRILAGVVFAFLAWAVARRVRAWAVLDQPHSERPERKRVARWIVANAISGPVLGVACYQWALQTTPSGVVMPLVATVPLAVIPLAWRFEGDRPGLRSLVGSVLAVAGAVGLAALR
jgi:drug/metabolite transporter (DMT)-like permease